MGIWVGPVLSRQEQEFCNGTTHELYFHHLGCSHAADDGSIGTCGEQCSSRLAILRQMGGCSFLRDLCHRFVYMDLGVGACVVAEGNGSSQPVATVVGVGPRRPAALADFDMCCQVACDDAVFCGGFQVESSASEARCRLMSTQLPPKVRHLGLEDIHEECGNYTWSRTPGVAAPGTSLVVDHADGVPGARCYKKAATTEFLESIAACSVWLSAGSSVAVITLFGAATTACMLQHSITTRRRGKKGACALLGKLLCPCKASAERAGRVKGLQLERGSSEAGSDTGEESEALLD
mmetsp:Transcript_108019/g.312139  ORF Transcript_108019/g.312139 Transcript_108019/m.312139 type:complete len:293 (+) Transcript_108019:1-879(+)